MAWSQSRRASWRKSHLLSVLKDSEKERGPEGLGEGYSKGGAVMWTHGKGVYSKQSRKPLAGLCLKQILYCHSSLWGPMEEDCDLWRKGGSRETREEAVVLQVTGWRRGEGGGVTVELDLRYILVK